MDVFVHSPVKAGRFVQARLITSTCTEFLPRMPVWGPGPCRFFRVYLRHPATTAPAWDYAETVVTACAAEPIAMPTPSGHATVARKWPCRAAHRQTEAIMKPAICWRPALSPGQQAAIHELERRVSHLLHDTLHGTFRLVSARRLRHALLTGGEGWRKGRLSTLDSLLTMAGSQLTLSSERFSALYQHILRGIAFVWSEQDRAILRREESQASDIAICRADCQRQLRPATIWPADDALQAVFDQIAAGLAPVKFCRTATRP